MGRWFEIVAVVVLFLVGCGKHPVDKVMYVADDDPRMKAAIETARSTVNTFISALESPQAGQSAFSIKMPFTDGSNNEHMWLAPVSFDGTNFQGTVNNEPEQVKSVKLGQKITVAPAEISDWMYIENRTLVGGHTLRAMRDALTPAERVEFDNSLPFIIGAKPQYQSIGDHAVLVHFEYGSTDLAALFALEKQLENAIKEAGVGGGASLTLSSLANYHRYPEFSRDHIIRLRFKDGWRYRIGGANDEG